LIAIARLARDEPAKAARFASLLEPILTEQQRGAMWGRIGHMAAYKQMPEAIEWYSNGGDQVGVGPEVARGGGVSGWQVVAGLRGVAPGRARMVKGSATRTSGCRPTCKPIRPGCSGTHAR